MVLKQKTTALEYKDLLRGNNGSNGRFEHYQFGSNVFLDIPSYQRNGDYRLEGNPVSNGHSSNVMLRLFIRDRFCDVPLQKCDFSKCENCHAKTYNSGIQKHLCYYPVTCPAVNPAMTLHETFAPLGYPARIYPNPKEAIDAGTNYA